MWGENKVKKCKFISKQFSHVDSAQILMVEKCNQIVFLALNYYSVLLNNTMWTYRK